MDASEAFRQEFAKFEPSGKAMLSGFKLLDPAEAEAVRPEYEMQSRRLLDRSEALARAGRSKWTLVGSPRPSAFDLERALIQWVQQEFLLPNIGVARLMFGVDASGRPIGAKALRYGCDLVLVESIRRRYAKSSSGEQAAVGVDGYDQLMSGELRMLWARYLWEQMRQHKRTALNALRADVAKDSLLHADAYIDHLERVTEERCINFLFHRAYRCSPRSDAFGMLTPGVISKLLGHDPSWSSSATANVGRTAESRARRAPLPDTSEVEQ